MQIPKPKIPAKLNNRASCVIFGTVGIIIVLILVVISTLHSQPPPEVKPSTNFVKVKRVYQLRPTPASDDIDNIYGKVLAPSRPTGNEEAQAEETKEAKAKTKPWLKLNGKAPQKSTSSEDQPNHGKMADKDGKRARTGDLADLPRKAKVEAVPTAAIEEEATARPQNMTEGNITGGEEQGAKNDVLDKLYERYMEDHEKEIGELCQMCEKLEGACDPIITDAAEDEGGKNSTVKAFGRTQDRFVQQICHTSGCCKGPEDDSKEA